jgi:uncharacterized protein
VDIALAVAFGVAIGLLLGLLGGGGSILAVPALVYGLGQDVRMATTTSLLVVGATALAGSLAHAREGRVGRRSALAFSVLAGAGSLAGTALNRTLDRQVILTLFALVLLAAAAAMLRHGRPHPSARGATSFKVVPVALAVGVLIGFFGVGGGFLIVPALVLLLAIPMERAVGTSLLVIALTSAVALSAHLATGEVDWPVASAMTVSAVGAAVAGARAAGRAPERTLRLGFAGLVLVTGLFLLAKNAPALA